jgi:hypothetical protein
MFQFYLFVLLPSLVVVAPLVDVIIEDSAHRWQHYDITATSHDLARETHLPRNCDLLRLITPIDIVVIMHDDVIDWRCDCDDRLQARLRGTFDWEALLIQPSRAKSPSNTPSGQTQFCFVLCFLVCVVLAEC